MLSGQSIYGADLPTDDGLLALRKALVSEPQITSDLSADSAGLIAACIGPSEQRPTAEEFARQLDAMPLTASPK